MVTQNAPFCNMKNFFFQISNSYYMGYHVWLLNFLNIENQSEPLQISSVLLCFYWGCLHAIIYSAKIWKIFYSIKIHIVWCITQSCEKKNFLMSIKYFFKIFEVDPFFCSHYLKILRRDLPDFQASWYGTFGSILG